MIKTITVSLRMSKGPILASIIFFAVGFIIGLFSKEGFSVTAYASSTNVLELLKNNVTVCLLMASGFFSFGLLSMFYLMSNGFILSGSIIESLQNGVPLYQIGFLLLPHGIFEIPALLLSGSIGFKSLEMIWKLCFANTKGVLLDLFKHMMILTLLIGCLLVTASIIEIYVTPLFK
ncbi:hypothetical protein B7C51_14975 [Paenibacillus larvae subsp. pulvifaciens]|uniref:Uncharacterized protein n=1 Tax=Paenibacillus larvae subsp. pulvifaciens TaxID=1477 RepID=A0A1V0UUK0_9BACL|nr:stage II sporulation protein M [Paenibacillus larvae]ARF68816.1 hypothetical protein B7C51_14975 [Paenibacillus larvae subsp. pulvifaciens]MCY9509845.1 stage II sporulation protein M [Paenibacillus larvae]MCY9523730.1 stage II sporulation protein M [Paenibacillus larvae]